MVSSSERNELAFTIKGDNGTIEYGEADHFITNRENKTFVLSGTNITNSTVNINTKMIQLRSTYQV